jgi:hypothetical protein
LMKQLCAHFATANQMRQHSEQAAANKRQQQQQQEHVGDASATDAVDFFHDVALLRRVIIGFVSCFNHTACMPLFKQELLAELVRHVLFAVAYQARKEDSASKSRDGRADSVSLTAHRTEIIATLATVICRLRLYDAASLGFFQWAAPICIAEADLLSGLQLSFILEAYSAVGLHDPVLFMTLGQKAGELGELLRDDEVARVLNALGRTKIDHSRLRASLESSMRMKNIHRRATHSTALF